MLVSRGGGGGEDIEDGKRRDGKGDLDETGARWAETVAFWSLQPNK